jgi:hypothetical protein
MIDRWVKMNIWQAGKAYTSLSRVCSPDSIYESVKNWVAEWSSYLNKLDQRGETEIFNYSAENNKRMQFQPKSWMIFANPDHLSRESKLLSNNDNAPPAP